jgi:hypothetical protein
MLVWLSLVKTGSLIFNAKILLTDIIIQAILQGRVISKALVDK